MGSEILPRTLIVEDQLTWRRLYKIWLRNICEPTFCTSREEAVESVRNSTFDVAVMDLGLPEPEEGIETIKDLLSQQQRLKIIVVSSFTDRELYLRIQKLGVYAVFQKDERLESELPLFIRKAYQMLELEKENQYLRQEFRSRSREYQLLGESEQAARLRERIRNMSQSDTPVLLTGATGVGKNFVAMMIHQLSPRSAKPFVQINCAALPTPLVESELFGYVRGAFTGADQSAKGKFEAAQGGSILLDEIGELPLPVQAKLLQVIEEKSFYPLGSHKKTSVDVRIIAATNRNLADELKQGNFREDLFYRLAGFTLEIPELSERKEDIPLYFDYFIRQECARENLPVPEIDPEVTDILMEYPWTGNIRELKNVVIRLLTFHPPRITVSDLVESNNGNSLPLLQRAVHKQYTLKELSALYARELYRKIGSKKKVAAILGIDNKTLNRYLNLEVNE